MPLAFQKRVPGVDVLVVGRVDEDLDLDRLAVARQVVRDDLADLQAAVVDRRADAQRAQVVGLQHELPARLPPVMIGGTSSPVNVRCVLFDLPASKPM